MKHVINLDHATKIKKFEQTVRYRSIVSIMPKNLILDLSRYATEGNQKLVLNDLESLKLRNERE